VLLAPPLMALLLVQILDSPSKAKLVLVVIAALGLVSAYQCAEQFLFSNQVTIKQYEQDPKSLLEPLGIEPGSFQQFMFEHRLYSGGVRGFFTTRNSAGSFALMALFAAVVLFLERLGSCKSNLSERLYLLGGGLAAAIILASLALTRSKGAIAGLLFAAVLLVVLRLFGSRLRPYRTAILAACVLLGVAGGWALVSYGLSRGRLPGGNSMLVRWQYWRASAQMYADHPLAGVGPGNFSHFYTRYKPAAALESVSDPHNFPLSLLAQYGPLGLVGFLAMLFAPLWRATSPELAGSLAKDVRYRPAFRTIATAFVIIIPAALLLIRPILMRTASNETLDVVIYVIVTMYIAPVAVFIVGFVLLAGPLGKAQDTTPQTWDRCAVAALCCAVLGVALHNLTDFAIFEPGVLTTFWAVIACLVAIDSRASRRPSLNLTPAPVVKILAVTIALAMIYAYLSYILVPVAITTSKIDLADQAISAGQFEPAHKLLDEAAKDDPLSAAALSLNGRLYLHQFELTHSDSLQLLTRAAECLQAAIARNDAAFKDFERLADAYYSLGEIAGRQEQAGWFNKAFEAASRSIERYPGCERLHFKLAQTAEQLGKAETAIEQYKKAIELEDQYRAQFKLMYPERQQIVSRLGEEKYQLAMKRVRELSEKSDK
jgi:O-antigen ligase